MENFKKYVYVTKDINKRDDFTKAKRFKCYKTDDCVNNSEKSDECSELLQSVLVQNGSGYYPTCEGADDNVDAESAEYLIEQRNKIKFALVGMGEKSEIFGDVIEKEIPFAMICPPDVKCEWLKMTNSKSFSIEECIYCSDKGGPCRKTCSRHSELYRRSTRQQEAVSKYKITLSTKLQHGLFKKVPIFELSTGIDIVRWFYFYRQYEEEIIKRKQRKIVEVKRLHEGLIRGNISNYPDKTEK